jgi:hypothetical protein
LRSGLGASLRGSSPTAAAAAEGGAENQGGGLAFLERESPRRKSMSVSISTLAPTTHSRAAERSLEPMKWSARRTVAFVVLVCSTFWLAFGALFAWLVSVV